AAVPSSEDERDYLGLPGLLDADQIDRVLRDRQARHLARTQRAERRTGVAPEESLHRVLGDKRKQLNSLVSQYARVSQRPHSHVHAELRRHCGGPPLAQATTEQVDARIEQVRRWLSSPGR
ncbi:MAG TPA: ATP-dependent helicase, partial [Propionibacteriaceae bacterium]|nr:ATP-dependent helicase [Propionibacteriaceae bacterium]